MKKMILIAFVGLLTIPQLSLACNTGDMDLAEGALRVVLDQPTDYAKSTGVKHMSEVDNTSPTEAFALLLNIEQRSPGLLQGKCKFNFEWSQYEEVQNLFKKVQDKYGMFYR